jgi:hypothetical protein
VLDTIRRIEIGWLLALSVAVAIAYQPIGFVAAYAMLAAALALIPKRETVVREDARLDLLNRLQAHGLDLRTRYILAREDEPTFERSQALWEVQREITVWLANSQDRLRRYPEFAGIYEFRRGRGGLIDELDRSLAALSELRRLSTISKNLQLPI